MLVYGGIGSRRTPPDICELMVECARLMAAKGWTLRTGGARGADDACNSGALLWTPPRVELYLPWHRFNDHQVARLYSPTEAAYELSARYHPAWDRLDQQARTLHARNAHIVLGANLDTPVDRIVCWTPDGCLDGLGPDCGGTGQALRIAAGEAPRCKVSNLARDDHAQRIYEFAGKPPIQAALFSA